MITTIKELQTVDFLRTFAAFSATLIHFPIENWYQLLPLRIKDLKLCLKEKSLCAIIALQYYKALYPFMEFIVNQLTNHTNRINQRFNNQSDRKSIFEDLTTILNKVYNISYQTFLKQEKEKYKELFSRGAKLIVEDAKPEQSSFKQLLDIFNGIQGILESQERRKKINSFINDKLMIEQAKSPFQQIALNLIKKKVQALQLEKEQYVCCRILFEHKSTSQKGKFGESNSQQFKDYRWPLQNESIKFHLTKTIVSYLNTTGGIVYVGLKEDKQKIIEVKGIKLSVKEKIDFLYFIHNQIMKGVLPKEEDRKHDELIQAQRKKQGKQPDLTTQYQRTIKDQFESKKLQYRINKFVYVDFIDIYDKDTLLNSSQDGSKLYIVRIKIKIGDYRELYHVINTDKQIPEAYFREQTSVKKKNLQQFYILLYERMKNNNPISNEKVEPHSYCRFNARCNEWPELTK